MSFASISLVLLDLAICVFPRNMRYPTEIRRSSLGYMTSQRKPVDIYPFSRSRFFPFSCYGVPQIEKEHLLLRFPFSNVIQHRRKREKIAFHA